jgi:hypothetical protein
MIGEFPMQRPFAILLTTLIAASPALAAERRFPVTGFEKVVLSGSPDVDVRVGPAPSVVATGEAADLDRLDIKVENGALVIGTKPGSWSWSSRKGVYIAVTTPAISAATISGSGDMKVDRVKGGPFAGRVSGSGDLTLPALSVTTLSLSISGSGTVTAAGTCSSGEIRVTGSGDVDAAGLTCGTLTAAVTGSGDVEARVTQTADLRVTGSGNITTAGGARCTTSTTGSGTIRCG